MRYVNGSLVQGEQVVYQAQLHWVMYVKHVFLMTFLVGFFTILWPLIRQWTTEMAVTNKRVIIKMGLISRRTMELNLNRIESVQVDQTFYGRIFNYGTMVFIGSGGTREVFDRIAHPLEFRKAIQAHTVAA